MLENNNNNNNNVYHYCYYYNGVGEHATERQRVPEDTQTKRLNT